MSLPYNAYEYSHTVVSCPFDESHRIARARLQRHILKCEKNYPPDYKVMCPYDATHRLNKSDLAKHVDTCPMRALIEPELYEFIRQRGSIGDEVTTLNMVEGLSDDVGQTDADDIEEDRDLSRNYQQDKNHCNELRPPRGYSEAMMTNTDDNIVADDTCESVASFMAVGRASCIKRNHEEMIQRIGRGRGKSFPFEL